MAEISLRHALPSMRADEQNVASPSGRSLMPNIGALSGSRLAKSVSKTRIWNSRRRKEIIQNSANLSIHPHLKHPRATGDMPRPNNRQNESQVHLQEPAGVSNEAGVLVRVALETERLAQTIRFRNHSRGRHRERPLRVLPRAVWRAQTALPIFLARRTARTRHTTGSGVQTPHDDDEAEWSKTCDIEGIAVGPQANAGEQDGSSGPLVRQAGTSRPSPPTATTRASTATDSLSATAHLQQRRGVLSKRPREDDDGEPSERKRERDERSKDGRWGK
uniref:Virulence protein n=1 Tax=Plasmid Ti TaxID=2512 RepID=Q44378_9ZZZZ|nr:virulence protein [Plasmid Ti]